MTKKKKRDIIKLKENNISAILNLQTKEDLQRRNLDCNKFNILSNIA